VLFSLLRVAFLGLLGILIIQLDFPVYLVFLDIVNSFISVFKLIFVTGLRMKYESLSLTRLLRGKIT
jgi:hypothetical protein